MFWISVLSIGFLKSINVYINKEIMKIYSRKFDCSLNRTWNIYKYFLNGLAISSDWVNKILFLITAKDTKFEVFFRNTVFLIPLQVFFKSITIVWK